VNIDWFTFGAQIVNFLILLALLRHFLYGPILEAMDQREAAIATRLDAARAKQEEAEQEADAYRSMQDELDRQRAETLSQAEQKAAERRQQLIHEARTEVDQMEQAWREALARERDSFLDALSARAAEEIIAVARRALNDLANARLEEQAVELFLERLRALEGAAQQDVTAALRSTDDAALVRSAFGLSEHQLSQVRRALADQVETADHPGAALTIAAETDPSLGFGVELRIGDRKVAWTLDSYLSHLLDRVRDRLDAEMKRTPATNKEARPESVSSNNP